VINVSRNCNHFTKLAVISVVKQEFSAGVEKQIAMYRNRSDILGKLVPNRDGRNDESAVAN